jgi:amino acid transporter
MMYLFFALIFIAYIYFGYKDDYKRDGAKFKNTIFGILGMVLLGIAIFFIKTKLDVHVKHAISVYYEDKLGMNKELGKIDSITNGAKIESFFKESAALKEKVDSAMFNYDVLFYILAYLIVVQLNKFIRKRFIFNRPKALFEN